MGDSYRPGRGGPRDRGPRRGGHDTYHPERVTRGLPPSYPPRRQPPRGDYYEPAPYGSLSYGIESSDFKFKGASQHQNGARRPEEQFTFTARGPSAPSFAPEAHYTDHGVSRRGRGGKFAARKERRDARPNNGRPQKRWGPRPAHERDLLKRDQRSSTPEQLEGMNFDTQPRFRDVEDASTSSGSDEDGPQTKRARLAASTDRPKWSNPDPYTALPPPDAVTGPKRDIVQVIRKAKADQMKDTAANSVSKNEDFISFDVSDKSSVRSSSPRMQYDDRASVESGEISGGAPLHVDDFSRTNNHDSRLPLEARIDVPPSLNSKRGRKNADHYDNELDEPVGRKRKRQHTVTDPDVVAVWQPHPEADATPWYREDCEQTGDVALRLHREVCDFHDYVRPLQEEKTIRLDLIRRISDSVQTWHGSEGQDLEVHAFGSFASDLYLPDADMDLVVLSKNFRRNGRPAIGIAHSNTSIRSLGKQLEKSGIVRPTSLVCIVGARVPLLKFVDALTGIKVDISFENASGLVAISTFEEWKAKYPAMPVVVVLVKQLLAMYGQNEVHTGGIGGFSIICLVVSMMQHMPAAQATSYQGEQHYGDLLMSFLELYGNRFDYERNGIIMEPPEYYDKKSMELVRAQEGRLTIIDPNNSENDISGGSRNIAQIFDIFNKAHAKIQQRLADLYQGRKSAGSILGCCWAADYDAFEMQRQTCLSVYDAVMSNGPPPGLLDVPAFYEWHFQAQPRKKKMPVGRRRQGFH